MNIFSKFKQKKEIIPTQFYKPSTTCQIPHLDWLYEKYFGQISNGTFVEVGAFDGEYVSNTSCLADLGWFGYYIEPVPEYYKKCIERHECNKNVKVINLAIGEDTQEVEINVSGVLSSIDKTSTKRFSQLDWSKTLISDKTINVKQISLNEFLDKNNISTEFELLSIDVEGYELNVLKGFDIGYWKPKIVIIELHDQNHDYKDVWPKMDEIVNYMDENQYKVIFKDFTNTVYCKNE